MKFFTSRFSLIWIFLILATPLAAQRNAVIKANEVFEASNYYDAVILYKRAYTKEKSTEGKQLILFRIGYSYFMIEDIDNAKGWLEKAIKSGYALPDGILYYAKTLKKIGLYEEAIVEFNKYLATNPEERGAKKQIASDIKSCEDAQDWMDKPTRFVVEKDPILNSKSADFSPAWADADYLSIVFTSSREGSTGDNIDPITGQNYSAIWQTTQDPKDQKWMVPTELGVEVGGINGNQSNEGSASLDSKFTSIYFTRCGGSKKAKVGCAVFFTHQVDGKWSEAKEFKINNVDTSIAGHPSIGLEDKYMFFSSDLPGGFGGKDIWFIKFDKRSKSWGNPTNLGRDINTIGNEMYPFIREDGTLFFASDGHPGMGSLDLFSAQKSGREIDGVRLKI